MRHWLGAAVRLRTFGTWQAEPKPHEQGALLMRWLSGDDSVPMDAALADAVRREFAAQHALRGELVEGAQRLAGELRLAATAAAAEVEAASGRDPFEQGVAHGQYHAHAHALQAVHDLHTEAVRLAGQVQ